MGQIVVVLLLVALLVGEALVWEAWRQWRGPCATDCDASEVT